MKKIFTGSVATLFFTGAFAETQQPASGENFLAATMVVIAIILAFVLWGMGQVLLALGKQSLEKSKANKILSLVVTISLLHSSLVSHAEEAAAVVTTPSGFNNGGLSTTFWLLASVIAIEFLAIAFMMFSIRRLQAELVERSTSRSAVSSFAKWWKARGASLFTKSVAVEKEADIMLDHDYDGIRELDNSLPPWWKYGFYVTIVIGFIYLLNFHVFGTGKNPEQEYQAEMTRAQLQIEEYNAKNADKVDENNLQLADASGISAGKEIFDGTCWTCHGKLGEGGAGPNLTDDYWLHKGSLTDVYGSIKHGYPDKGMQAWEKNYSPKQILNLASYIKSIRGSNPAGAKAAQGELFAENTPLPTTDSLKK